MASKARGGLGKGLGALLQNNTLVAAPHQDGVQEISVDEIQANRYQPRQDFDEAALGDLEESIRSYGVLQPILVRKLPQNGYELIAGERRLRAARQANIQNIPAIVREFNDAQISEIALIENIQREDLNVLEEARAYERLMKEFQYTQETVAKNLGRSRSHIANTLRLLKLAPKVQEYVANGSLSMGQARPLLALENQEQQCEAADKIQEEGLSARQSEALVKRLLNSKEEGTTEEKQEATSETSEQEQALYLREAEDKLTEYLGTQVKITPGKRKSRIQIDFYSEEDLSRILESLMKSSADAKQRMIEELRKASLSKKFTV